MYKFRSRFLFAILFTLLLCSSAQATTTLQITVQDNIDNTTLSHATVFVNGGNYARTNANGQVLLTHSGLNDQVIQVSMSGYDDWTQTVSKNTTLLLVNLSRKTLTFKVTLFDSDTLAPISNARVNISAENVSQAKQTDSSGTATFAVTAATIYSLDINAPNYQERSATIDMGTENQEVQYKLLSGNSFSFVVKDKDTGLGLPGAEVILNTESFGKTDSRGILITPVPRGKSYSIEIKKDGYQSYISSQTITTSDAIFTATLTKSPIGAIVYVTDDSRKPLSGVAVYVNGTLAGTTNDYGRMNVQNLVTGGYTIDVRKDGYVSQEKVITVSGQSGDYSFTMPYENAALTVFVQDKEKKVVPNASVFVDGNPVGVTDDDGQLLTHVSFNTELNISATKDGYQSQSVKTQVIQGNATATTTVIMEKSLDWGLIGMIFLGVIGIILLFTIIRILGHRKRRHIMRRNEI